MKKDRIPQVLSNWWMVDFEKKLRRRSCRKTDTDEEDWLLDNPHKVEMSQEKEDDGYQACGTLMGQKKKDTEHQQNDWQGITTELGGRHVPVALILL
jgi:hypothetical protein